MPNALTGDFDVVAEVAVPTVNRVLAAMHALERFFHSLTIRVDDTPAGPKVDRPIVVGVLDGFGDPVTDHTSIGPPHPLPGQLVATNPIYSALDPLVNPDLAGVAVGPLVPSHLKGRAQLQLSPPTLEVPDASGTKITVRMNIMGRYLPDPNTSPLAEFIRGDLQITAAVDQIASGPANVIDINFKADQAFISFTPSWSSRPLTAEDLAGINLAIRNALKTSFLPSSAALPSNVKYVQLKTLLAPPGAIGVLMDLTGTATHGTAFNKVFLDGGDDFAFAVGIDYLRAVLQPTLDNILGKSYRVTIPIDVYVDTYHVVYSVTPNSGTLELQNDVMILRLQGRAVELSDKWYAPDDFTFTAQLKFTLQAHGATVDLVPGDVSLDTSSTIANAFKGKAKDGMRQARDQALQQSGTYDTVRAMLDANRNLGDFLNSLLAPPDPLRPVASPYGLQLAYTSVKILPSGVVLHGTMAMTDTRPVLTLGTHSANMPRLLGWPLPHVEFEQIPSAGGGIVPESVYQGPDYSALKTWIPGGAIEQYEWSRGQAPPHVDNHTFVLLHASPEVVSDGALSVTPSAPPQPIVSSGYTPLCLTVRGSRYSPSGPVVKQPVSASSCGYTAFPVISAGLMSTLEDAVPTVVLTQPGPGGMLQVIGHTPVRLNQSDGDSPNLIVHFADEKTASSLERLTQSLRDSRRDDAATAVLAVLTPNQLAKARHTDGILYTEDQGGAWERVFGVKTPRRPLTLIAGPRGEVVWQHEGDIDTADLAAALRTRLVKAGPVRPRMRGLNVRIGRPAPNFLFELAPGRGLTLRKLWGRPAILVFWKSSSKPSLDAVRDLQTRGKAGGPGPVLLAINDGEAPELARRIAAQNGLSATVVVDPERQISLAYGVSLWPTIVSLDASGVVREIRYGRLAGAPGEASSYEQADASR